MALFSESNGRFLVTVAEGDADKFEQEFEGLRCVRAGRVTAGDRLTVRHGETSWLDLPLGRMTEKFKERLSDD